MRLLNCASARKHIKNQISIREGVRMKLLSREERKTIRAFLKAPIPKYVYEHEAGRFDLMDCYEVAFAFSNGLLRGKKINPNASPWGDGQSIIFDPDYTKLLTDMQNSNLGTDVNGYCDKFLKTLDVLKAHFA